MKPTPKQRQLERGLLAAAGVAAICGFAAVYSMSASASSEVKAINAATTTASLPANRPAMQGPVNLADLIEEVSPAVVQITATGHADDTISFSGGHDIPDEMLEGPFGDFFRKFFEDRPGSPRFRTPVPERAALGSGFIIDDDGIIVTNNHVVDGAENFHITLKDEREFDAQLLGIDDRTDLAVLKIDAKGKLPTVHWGDSDHLRVGDSVFAVGAPFGLTGTVTAGIVSARGREIGAGPYDDFIQIDAPINQGNSGGPLFDSNGAVIGVNTAIFSPSGGNVGIGFAIPAQMAKSIVAQIAENGAVERGWLGVSIQSVTKDMAASLGLNDAKGAIVGEVSPDSPAQKARLKDGDVIVKYDGKSIEDAGDLSRAVAETPANHRAKIVLFRNGEERIVTAKIKKLSHEAPRLARSESQNGFGDHEFDALGLALGNEEDRVVILAVDPESPAAETGIRAGDTILSVNQREVTSADEAEAAILSAKHKSRPSVLAQVERQGQDAFVVIPFDVS